MTVVFNWNKECKPEKEKKFITVCMSALEDTENWLYIFFSISIFLLVSNTNLNDSATLGL